MGRRGEVNNFPSSSSFFLFIELKKSSDVRMQEFRCYAYRHMWGGYEEEDWLYIYIYIYCLILVVFACKSGQLEVIRFWSETKSQSTKRNVYCKTGSSWTDLRNHIDKHCDWQLPFVHENKRTDAKNWRREKREREKDRQLETQVNT